MCEEDVQILCEKDVQILCATNSLCQHTVEPWHDHFDDDMQVFILPTIRINNGQYRGKLAYAEVLQAICAGFSYGAEPSVCMQEDTCREGSQPDTDCKAK